LTHQPHLGTQANGRNQEPKAHSCFKERRRGRYSAQRLELPDAMSQGETKKETLTNIREAIKGYLEAFPEELEQLKRKRQLVQITI